MKYIFYIQNLISTHPIFYPHNFQRLVFNILRWIYIQEKSTLTSNHTMHYDQIKKEIPQSLHDSLPIERKHHGATKSFWGCKFINCSRILLGPLNILQFTHLYAKYYGFQKTVCVSFV